MGASLFLQAAFFRGSALLSPFPQASHIILSQFIAYTIVGTIPWTIFLVYTGEILGENWMLLLEYKIEIALISFLTAGSIAVAFYFWQKSKKHEK